MDIHLTVIGRNRRILSGSSGNAEALPFLKPGAARENLTAEIMIDILPDAGAVRRKLRKGLFVFIRVYAILIRPA